MNVAEGDPVETPIWDDYKAIVAKHDERGVGAVGSLDKADFYAEVKKSHAIITTSEVALYANILLQKGVVI